MSDNTKTILTYVSLGLVVGVAVTIFIHKKNAKTSQYQSNAKNDKLDAEMEALLKKIGEAKK
jgi:uncharacterized membrane-anchored protein YhcB (DUF1043 family)